MLLPALDYQTAFGMTALSSWALVGVLWLLGRSFWKQGVPYAMGAGVGFGMAYALLALQKSLPYAAIVTASHLCIMVSISLMALCYRRFRQIPWGREDWLVLGIPALLFALTWLLARDDFALQVRMRGVIFIGQMLYQLHVLWRMRSTNTSTGWTLVVVAQVIQMASLLPLVLVGDRTPNTDLQLGASGWVTVLQWVMCMVMFLNLQATPYGYLRMLHDRRGEMERKAAALDGLTQLPSRRTLMGHAPSAMEQAEADGMPLGLLVLDIDHFKKVNDMYGHLGGDAVIQRVAWVLRNQIRQQDFAARYGGEEFVVLIPNATPAIVLAAAERIAEGVRAEAVPVDGARVSVTVSLGGHVQRVSAGMRWEELLAAADAALYEAKNNGRDRVVLSAVCRAQMAPAMPEPGAPITRRGPETGERRDDAARG